MNTEVIENFIDSLHCPHLDNAQKIYTAKQIGRRFSPQTVSPLTNFVFEYFLFNSLYSIDWPSSIENEQLIEHSRSDNSFSESKQQREFVKFCRSRFKDDMNSSDISEAFLPLAALNDLDSNWTKISPDRRISVQQGQRFFSKIARLAELAQKGELEATKNHFELVDDCCYFVYLVRNNIFHGAKSIGNIYELEQARRIAVYDLFIRCLNSLFFLAFGRREHGAAFAQLPIVQCVGDSKITIEIQDIHRLLQDTLLKPEDSFLHWRLYRGNFAYEKIGEGVKRALFYPSAGKDLLFPLIIGMPHCTDFYFYNKSSNRNVPISRLLKMLGVIVNPISKTNGDTQFYEFEFDKTPRRIWIIQRDNREFLDQEIRLAFYFHRGDSEGEGGSGQSWDSELLTQLISKAPRETGLRILTDGEPGGLTEGVKSQLASISPANSHRRRDYFYGVLRHGTI